MIKHLLPKLSMIALSFTISTTLSSEQIKSQSYSKLVQTVKSAQQVESKVEHAPTYQLNNPFRFHASTNMGNLNLSTATPIEKTYERKNFVRTRGVNERTSSAKPVEAKNQSKKLLFNIGKKSSKKTDKKIKSWRH